MVTRYPAAIDTVFTLKPILDGLPVTGGSVEQLREAIIAIEEELGVKPSSIYATVRARLDAIEGIVGNLRIIELQNDLGGTLEDPQVIGILGRPISDVPPVPGEAYVWDGLAWTPGSLAANVHFDGDLRGDPVTQQVVGIQTIPVRPKSFAASGEFLEVSNALDFSSCVVYDGTDLWVTSLNDVLVRINTSGTDTVVALIPLPETYFGLDHQNSITFDDTHVYVSVFGHYTIGLTTIPVGRVFIIEKATNSIVGVIKTADSQKSFGVAVDGDKIFVASGSQSLNLTSTFGNQSQIDIYSKSQVLGAYPAFGTSLGNTGTAPGKSYHGGLIVFNDFLFATSYATNGTIYKFDLNLGPIDSYSAGVGTIITNMVVVNGFIWVGLNDLIKQRVAKFNPDDLTSGPIPTQIDISFGGYGEYLSSFGDRWIIVTHGNSSFIETVDTTIGAEVAYDIDLEDGGEYGVSYTDGTYQWTCNRASGPQGIGIYAMNTAGLPNVNINHVFEGGLEIKYVTPTPPPVITFAGDLSGTNSTQTVVGIENIPIDTTTGLLNGNVLTLEYAAPAAGVFNSPQGITTDGTYLWVGNRTTKTIDKLNIATSQVDHLDYSGFIDPGSQSFPRKLHINQSLSPYLFVACMDSFKVLVIDITTNAVIGVGDTVSNRARSVTIDNLGNVWVSTHSGNATVQRFIIADLLANFPTPVPAASEVFINTDAEEIVFDGTDVWCGSFSGDINRISPAGNGNVIASVNNGSSAQSILAVGGLIFVLDQGGQQIQQYDPGTFPAGPVDSVALTGVQYLREFAFSAGFLWVPDQQAGSGTNLIQVGIAPLAQLISYPPSLPVDAYADLIPSLSLNRIYIVANTATPSSDLGVRTFDTVGEAFLNSYTQTNVFGPPALRFDTSGSSVVIFQGGSPTENLSTIKTNQSNVATGKTGIVNFSADTTESTSGANSDFATIVGGDQNFIDDDAFGAHAGIKNYSTIVGGWQNSVAAVESFIGGGFSNSITGGEGNSFPEGNCILGGYNNSITLGAATTIVGGINNSIADSLRGFIGGGSGNNIGPFGTSSTIGGGSNNTVSPSCAIATIAGGSDNIAGSQSATVGGGASNTASGIFSTVPGGASNLASGSYSFACGVAAIATREMQWAYAGSGVFASVGDGPQYSMFFVKGESDNGVANQLSADPFGPTQLNLNDGVAYMIRATCVANRLTVGGRATFVHTILAHATAGSAVIDSDTATTSIPNGQAWTIVFSTSGPNIVATFTGTAGQNVRATVLYEFVELPGGV